MGYFLIRPSCEDLNLVVREMNQLFTDTLQHADTSVATLPRCHAWVKSSWLPQTFRMKWMNTSSVIQLLGIILVAYTRNHDKPLYSYTDPFLSTTNSATSRVFWTRLVQHSEQGYWYIQYSHACCTVLDLSWRKHAAKRVWQQECESLAAFARTLTRWICLTEWRAGLTGALCWSVLCLVQICQDPF